MEPVPMTARLGFFAGILALVLAVAGALATVFLDPATTVQVLGILIWVVGVLAVVGLVLGIMSGLRGPGRSGALISVVTLALLGLFLTYSGFGVSSSGSPAPVATGG